MTAHRQPDDREPDHDHEYDYDHDVVVIGSGFGGSVAALRLAEKGYRVHVYEAGRRFEDEDFARTSYHLRRYLGSAPGLFRCAAHPPAS